MHEEVLIVGQDPRSTDVKSQVTSNLNRGGQGTPAKGIELVLVFGLFVAGHHWRIRASHAWIR